MSNRESRRNFFATLGSSCAALFAAGVTARASTDSREGGVFAGQFLQKGRVIEIPAGYYDPQQRLFIRKDTGRPLVADEQMTGSWTYSDTVRCTNMFYPNNGNPYCAAYDSDQDQHPDGFKPGE